MRGHLVDHWNVSEVQLLALLGLSKRAKRQPMHATDSTFGLTFGPLLHSILVRFRLVVAHSASAKDRLHPAYIPSLAFLRFRQHPLPEPHHLQLPSQFIGSNNLSKFVPLNQTFQDRYLRLSFIELLFRPYPSSEQMNRERGDDAPIYEERDQRT